jgi:DNA polymerase-1
MSTANGTLPRTAREAARYHLARGEYSVPVPARSKKCVLHEWSKLRVTETDIDSLFSTDGNIGLLLGVPSDGLVDIDLDCPEAIAAAPYLLPETGRVSGRQSAPTSHYWYTTEQPPEKAADEYLDPIATKGNRNCLLELRSTGGMTVVPPSVYPAEPKKGRPHPEPCVWHRHDPPRRVAIDELRAAVGAVAAAALLARYWPEGARHDAALALSGGLLRAGWPAEQVERFLRAVCAAAGDPEVKDRLAAVRDTATTIKEGKNTTGWPTFKKLLGRNGDPIVTQVTLWLGTGLTETPDEDFGNSAISAISAWPPSVPLDAAPDVPDYPVEVLPPWLRSWAEAVALELQVPVDLPAALGLGLVAAGVARKVIVQPRAGFTEPVNQFGMVLLPPGDRKTQTFRRAIAPVQQLQREAREAAAPRIQEAESDQRVAEKRVKHLEDKIAKTEDPAEKEQLRTDLKTAREEHAKIEVPAEPLLYTEDDTPESLKLELVRQGGRMMVATTEAKCLENITLYADRPNFDVYLKGHAGDEINSGRITRGRDTVTDPALTCLLTPQPAVAQGLAENEILRGRGFLARWLYSLPVSRVGNRAIATPAVPDAVRAEYARLMRKAWQVEYDADELGGREPHALEFGEAAAGAFAEFEAWIEPQLAPGRPLARMTGWGSKLNGACVRLAAALHIADALGRGDPWSDPIALATVQRAIRLCREYYLPHAAAAFDLMGADATVTGARRVWQWIAEERLSEFSKRDAFNASRAVFDTVDQLQPCLDLLERHYLIRQRGPATRQGRGRPSSPMYDVNPDTAAPARAGGDPGGDPPPPDSSVPPPTHKSHKSQNSTREPEAPPAHKSHKSHKSGEETVADISADSAISARGVPAPNAPAPPEVEEEMAAATEVRPVDSCRGDTASVVQSPEGVAELVSHLRGAGRVGLDIETTGLSHARDRARLLSLATSTGMFLVDLFRVDDSLLWPALAAVEVVGHNLGFDLPFLMRLGFVPGRVRDTMLASQVLHAGNRNIGHSLKELAHRHLGVTLNKEMQTADWSGPLSPAHIEYAALDAELPLALWDRLGAELASANLTATADTEMATLPAVAWAAVRGVGFDRVAWEALAVETEAAAACLRSELDAAAPNPANLFGVTNWNSPEEVKTAFRALGLELDSTDDDALAGVAHPAAELLREYRVAAKLSGTYGREWLRHVAPDGRVYATWRQIGAGASGRMSCKEPNLQQLPRDARFRRCFAAPAGRVLVKADYSQVELRIAAKLAGDERMLDAYHRGEDLHTNTARAVLGKQEVTKADRQLAKSLAFGLLYGMGAKSLAVYASSNFGVALTETEATRHRETFFRTYPGLRAWHQAVPNGTVQTRTLAGRRRVGVTAFTEKLNTPVQGCLQPQVRVLTDAGYIPIGRLYETGSSGRKVWTGTKWATFTVHNRGPCQFAQVALQDGTVLDCDTRHQLLLVTDAGYQWRGYAELQAGDQVATPLARAMEFTPPAPLGDCDGVPVDADFWHWIGYYYGNGWIGQERGELAYAFGPQPHRLAERAECEAYWRGRKVNAVCRNQPRADRPGEYAYNLTIYRAALIRALACIGVGGGNAHTKRFPERIFRETSDHRVAFIRGFLAADGYLRCPVSTNPSVHLCQRGILTDLKLLLRTLGVESVLRGPYRNGRHESYRLDIHRRMYEGAFGTRQPNWPRLRGMDAPKFVIDELLARYGDIPATAFPTDSSYTLYRRLHGGGAVSAYTLDRLCRLMGWTLDTPLYGCRQVSWKLELPTVTDTYTLSVDDPLHRYDSEGVISKNTGADGLKRALALLWERRAACPDAFPVLLVHDEIVVECDESRREETTAWVRDAMKGGMAPLLDPVPVEVEVAVGRTWGG